ncbi:LXG domain of WXG superfamily protein [Streptococcus equinus]|uniref:LXG domain of WXG superfamily protein n=1 Tax=Streptococcus equinus TaxID=1335 RepID=A0A1H0XWS4_STREI|nr:T7SS effector LXG polymorphic toxin [Streptococcus equinus]SDQ07305.1 LXG domain of WXG superfamily protein [Streptococcus equinus]
MKIKMSEVIAQRDSLKSSISQTKSQLSSAKKKLKSAANSEALKGDVKDVIDNKINNYQVPLLTNYVNSLDVISQGYDNLISTFKSIVSENSDSAIIDTDVLQQTVDKFDSPLEQLKTSSDAINKAIDDVADIVTLTKVTTDDAISEFRGAKKVLTNTIKDMGTFNNTVFTSEAGDILDEQNTQIASLSDLGSGSYTSKKAKDFYKKTAFKTEVKETKLVVSGKARRDQLKNELAKNLYDSKYSGYMDEKILSSTNVPEAVMVTYKKSEKLDRNSQALLKKAKEDRDKGVISKATYQSIKSGLASSGGSFLKELAQSKITDEAAEKFTKGALEWLVQNTQNTQYAAVGALAGGGVHTVPIDVNPAYSRFVVGVAKHGTVVVGSAIDFGMQVSSGEDVVDAGVKTGAHVAIGTAGAETGAVIGAELGAVTIPVIGAVPGAVIGGVAGVVISVGGAMLFDSTYDNVIKPFVGNPKECMDDVGEAVSGFFNNLGNVFQ